MSRHELIFRGLPAALLALLALPAGAQSFRVQCPTSTITHPAANNDNEPAYTGPTPFTCTVTGGCAGSGAPNAPRSGAWTTGYLKPTGTGNGAIRCQQISGGDGYATMGDGTQTYMFSFGPLSGLAHIVNGNTGAEPPSVFNMVANPPPVPGDPATTLDAGQPFGYNGAVGLSGNVPFVASVFDASEVGSTVTIVLNTASPFSVGDLVVVSNVGAGYDGTWKVTAINVTNPFFAGNYAFKYQAKTTGLAEMQSVTAGNTTATAANVPAVDGHVDPRQVMDVGVMNGNIPAPLMAIDEDDEFFLTLTNVGMIMRPDLFEQHTVHFHGYPNASAFYDGVPDASVAINIGGSFTYYYLAPDAGTYFWHCHITPPEHLQMGMVGQLYVRPRQNRWVGDLFAGLSQQQADLRTACTSSTDVLCSNPLPKVNTHATNNGNQMYAYNDGDGTTRYDVEYPLQMHGFDPNFHFVGMTFNPEGFTDMKDKYFLLNGRGYPDTVNPKPLETPSADGVNHYSQPLPSIISIPANGRALIRLSNLSVSEYHTLASLGVPMQVIALNAKLLRDQAGNNLYYLTNSITLGGGESLDVILDAKGIPKGTYYLYTPNLDHLSNDAENFGGMMTEVHVCNAAIDPATKTCL
jgi:hypothetical protein